jgi:Flp pilus assembly protein TadD
MNRARKRFFFSLLTVLFLMGVVSIGCANKKGNVWGEYPNIQSAKDLHLKQTSSLDTDSPKELPEMSFEEHERLGDVSFGRGDLGMAFIHYEKSLKLKSGNSNIHYKKGLLLAIGGMNEEAIAEFNKALKGEPKHALSHEGLGIAYFQIKKYHDAETWFKRAVDLDPKLWKAHNFLGVIYDYREQYKKAVRQYEAAISLKDDDGLLYNNLGTSYSLAGDYENAVKALKRGLSTKNAKNKIYNNLGLVLSKAGKYNEAWEAFRKGGNEAQAYNNLGCAYLEQGKYKGAIRCFEKAIQLRPTFYKKASENLRKAKMAHEPSPLGLELDVP